MANENAFGREYRPKPPVSEAIDDETKARYAALDEALNKQTAQTENAAELKASSNVESAVVVEKVSHDIEMRSRVRFLTKQLQKTAEGEAKEILSAEIKELQQALRSKQPIEKKSESPIAQELVGTELANDPEAVALYDLRRSNVFAAFRVYLKSKREITELEQQKNEILHAVEARVSYPHLTKQEENLIHEIHALIEESKNDIEQVRETPDGYYAVHYAELKSYREALDQGQLVETPSVKNSVEIVLDKLQAGTPVFIHGDLGTGKTELAYHVSRRYLGKEPLIVSGRKDISEYELFAHNVLDTSGVTDQVKSSEMQRVFLEKLEQQYSKWEEQNSDADDQTKNKVRDDIRAGLIVELESQYAKQTISTIHLGPIYKAMETGVPVIVDEANAIPHEMLIGLNHLLTRRAGDIVEVQQDSGKTITVAPGFCFIFTGNIDQKGGQYIGRQELDPAFLSRLHIVKHDYPPQATDSSFDSFQASHFETTDETAVPHEQFDIIISMLTNGVGTLNFPKDSLHDVWELAKVARVFQDNFSRSSVDSKFFVTNGSAPIPYNLQKSVLSVRGIKAIIDSWQRDNFTRPLGYYVWENFVSQATVPQDKAYMYALIKQSSDLFPEDSFKETNSPIDSNGVLATNFSLTYVGKDTRPELVTLAPREIIDTLYGQGPERTEFPVIVPKQEVSQSEEAAQEIEKRLAEYMSRLEGFKVFGTSLETLAKRTENYCRVAGT